MRLYFQRYFTIIVFCLTVTLAYGQEKATLYGKVTDRNDNSPLVGANIIIKGTALGKSADLDGNYRIENIKPGEYSIEVSYIGYEKMLFTGIKLKDGEVRQLNVKLGTQNLTVEQEVVIVGERPLVDVEESKSKQTIGKDKIENAPARQIQEVLNTQPGIINSPTGLHIRGSRSYETGFYIDDVSAKDPLSGTGFGVDIGSNSLRDIEITTGGSGVEYGNNTAGVVNAQTRTGGDKFEGSFLYKRDNFGFNRNWNSVFNQQVMELNLGGPIKIVKNRLTYFTSLRFNLSDEYFKNPANQLTSSVYNKNFGNFWSPQQDNRWSGLFKMSYQLRQNMFLTGSYIKSVTVNQDLNMLRITGSDIPYTPGYQYSFSRQMDNANTFTHDLNMQSLTLSHNVSSKVSYKLIASRLFVKLRADANGRAWRPEVVNTEFDPRSIIEYPVGLFNPGDSVVFVNSPSGFINNNGIATLWHDHVVDEKTLRFTGAVQSRNGVNRFNFGSEFKHQYLQWIDITRPWIGAPIALASGGESQSFRLGEVSDIWRVKPINGAFFVSDQIRFSGLITEFGGRFEYWLPGKFVDDAIADPRSPIRDEIREQYKKQSLRIGDRHVKMRLLPKISASFPIKENQVIYFNYGHSTVQPHPSFVYTGLDPYYQDRSTLSFVGNPNLNPEVDISYELGLKSQITSDDVLSLAAFWKDKYDFITLASVEIKDVTGREVTRTMRINSDYARTRGIEATYIKRIGKWFSGQISGSYSIATGQSSSASDALRDILNTGNREDTREYYLPWDNPVDLKTNILFTHNTSHGFLNIKPLNKFRIYAEGNFRTGRRYTPFKLTGYEQFSGRPIYEAETDPSLRFSKLATSTFSADLTINKWWNVKKARITWSLEITNIFNNRNTIIPNPVTGTAYSYGDPVPENLRDPVYDDPRDPRSRNLSPENPARYLQPRHFLTGFGIAF